MPSDVNIPDGSSPEDQRNGSDSHTDNDSSHLDGELQVLESKPGISDLVDRLMSPREEDPADDLENHNEDEEGKESKDKGDEPAAGDDAPLDDEGLEADDAKKPAAKADAKEGDEPADEEGDAPADEEGDAEPEITESRDFTNEANKRIRQLIKIRKDLEAKLEEKQIAAGVAEKDAEIETLREKASYRDQLEQTLAEHKLDSKVWDEWTNIGLLMQRDPARAAVILGRMATAMGYQDPNGPIAKLDDDLTAMVTSQDMTKEAAEKIQRSRLIDRERMPAAPPRNAPVAPVDARTGTPSLPRLTRDETAIGQQAIKAVNAEFQKKYPDQWLKLVPEIQKEMATYKGSPPHLWGKIARECAEKVVARRRAKASVASRPDQSLRASGGSSSRAVTRNNTGPAKSKSELADRMVKITGGKS